VVTCMQSQESYYKSTDFRVTCGVLQGGILSSFMFNIHGNPKKLHISICLMLN